MPHSEIPGSTIARISPGLFAACHVLHRLSVPRHPPDALVIRSLRSTPSQPAGNGINPLPTNPIDGAPEPRRAQRQTPVANPPAKPRHARPPAGVTGRTSLVPQHSPRVVGAGLTRARPRFHEDTSPDGHSCSRTRPPLAAIARLPLPEAVRLGHIHKFALPDQSTPAPQTRQPRGSPRPAHRPRNKPGLLRMSPIPPPRWCQARAAPTAALIAA